MTGSLLASSALTVAAEGAIITEPPDFGNSSPTVLPAGATGFSGIAGVTGSPGNWVADVDIVEFSGLKPGPLAYLATFPGTDGLFFLTSSNTLISTKTRLAPAKSTFPPTACSGSRWAVRACPAPIPSSSAAPCPSPARSPASRWASARWPPSGGRRRNVAMSYLVTQILTLAAAAEMAHVLTEATFADGRYSATGAAAGVKHNLQAQSGTEGLDQQLLRALEQHDYFATFALPLKIASPTFARYEPGMAYGAHVDTALAHGLRSDLAMPLFLSPPESYDGGELVIEETFGGQEIKLGAGEAIIYSATTLHRVAPVTRGARLVAVTWIQSRVRDSRLREIIYDLSRGMALAHPALPPEALSLLNKCRQNLLRTAADA